MRRQGDPLSLYVFTVVRVSFRGSYIETLVEDLQHASNFPCDATLVYLRYVDDTLIHAPTDDAYLLNLKLLLYCFTFTFEPHILFTKSNTYNHASSSYDAHEPQISWIVNLYAFHSTISSNPLKLTCHILGN